MEWKTFTAICGILVTAGGLLFTTTIANFAGTKATEAVIDGVKPLTSQIPNADNTIKNAQTWDDLKSLSDDTKNVRKSATGGFSNIMSFGFPIMVVLAAGVAIARKIQQG